jgi:hypothetical protein
MEDPPEETRMSPTSPTRYGRIRPPDEAWLAKAQAEPILEPELPIIDTHHHCMEFPFPIGTSDGATTSFVFVRWEMAGDCHGWPITGEDLVKALGKRNMSIDDVCMWQQNKDQIHENNSTSGRDPSR